MSFGVTAEQLRVLNLALKDERLEKFDEFGGIDSLVKALRSDLKNGLRNEMDDSRAQAYVHKTVTFFNHTIGLAATLIQKPN
jgi:hypothetical protein